MKLKYLLAVSFILLTVIAGGFTACSKEQGPLPRFATGDKFVSKWSTGGSVYTVTSEIIGSEIVNGKDCYVMKLIFDPAFQGSLVSVINKYDKATTNIVFMDMKTTNINEFTTATYEITGDEAYPLSVGKIYKQVEIMTITSGNEKGSSTQNSTSTSTAKVEAIENVTVPAGTFRCFRIVKYDQDGNITQISWRPADTKFFQVKMTDPTEPDATYELISFTVK